MSSILLHNGTIVTGAIEAVGSILVTEGRIADVLYSESDGYAEKIAEIKERNAGLEVWDLTGLHVMAGGIDPHVHFREPGLTHKADMHTESMAAAAGGITTAFDMPNTSPATVDAAALRNKISLASEKSVIRLGFHIGATNSNIDAIERLVTYGDEDAGIRPEDIAGVKVFMGSSTGNMLVDDRIALERLFSIKAKPVLVHCEDESTIKANLQTAIEKYGDDIPFSEHEHIRSRSACIRSSIRALEMAMRCGTRLVLCHISTKEEIEMARAAKMTNPDIITETSCNYLWFCNEAYDRLGSRAKCNPSIKTAEDRTALREGLMNGTIDIIGSDHAPHLETEKDGIYTKAPSGMPSIQHTLPILLTIAHQEDIPLTRIASVFSEKASEIYGLMSGKIKYGYAADLVIFDKDKEFIVRKEDLLGKCGWSPYEGETLKGKIEKVLVKGEIVYNS